MPDDIKENEETKEDLKEEVFESSKKEDESNSDSKGEATGTSEVASHEGQLQRQMTQSSDTTETPMSMASTSKY